MFLPRRLLLPLAVVTAAIALVGVINLALPHATQAAAFVVTKTADTNDGECSADDCSLREAVVAANAAAGPDTITVPPGTYTLTLAGASEEAAATGDLDITDDVTIIDGNAADRAFELNAGVTAAIERLWVRNGSAPNGGGIQNAGNLTLSDVLVRENAAGSSTTAKGGGVANSGTLVLLSSEVELNTTTGSGGGRNNTGEMTLTDSTERQNAADVSGGGINQSSGGSLTISGSTISENTAGSAAVGGGGILADGGTVTITLSTIRGNSATKNGGGISAGQNATISITDSTLDTNTANDGGDGDTILWIGISLAITALVALAAWRVERSIRPKA